MQPNDYIELLQNRLGDPLSEDQLEFLLAEAAKQPSLFAAASQEIKAQKLEVIPVDLDDEDAMQDLLDWLTQLAATRNAGKGFNQFLIAVAVVLLIASVGSWFVFFRPVDEKLAENIPPTPLSENSTDADMPDTGDPQNTVTLTPEVSPAVVVEESPT